MHFNLASYAIQIVLKFWILPWQGSQKVRNWFIQQLMKINYGHCYSAMLEFGLDVHQWKAGCSFSYFVSYVHVYNWWKTKTIFDLHHSKQTYVASAHMVRCMKMK